MTMIPRAIAVSLVMVLLVSAPSAFAELTKEDLQEIEAIVQRSEARLREYVDLKLAAQNAQIDARSKGIDERFNRVDEQFRRTVQRNRCAFRCCSSPY